MKIFELKRAEQIQFGSKKLTFIDCDGMYGKFENENGETLFLVCFETVEHIKLLGEKINPTKK